ncbi:hypothetical protein H0H92_000535 [Tricholoma furcatifolium]|nr:hypothetical protein H0H92_000535 [Tricholoma furcatifolium]
MPTHDPAPPPHTPLAPHDTSSLPTQANFLFSVGSRRADTIHQLFNIPEWTADDVWGYGRKTARVGDWLTISDTSTYGDYPDTYKSVETRLIALQPSEGWSPVGPDWTTFLAYNRHTKQLMAIHTPRSMVDGEGEKTDYGEQGEDAAKEITDHFIEEFVIDLIRKKEKMITKAMPPIDSGR